MEKALAVLSDQEQALVTSNNKIKDRPPYVADWVCEITTGQTFFLLEEEKEEIKKAEVSGLPALWIRDVRIPLGGYIKRFEKISPDSFLLYKKSQHDKDDKFMVKDKLSGKSYEVSEAMWNHLQVKFNS